MKNLLILDLEANFYKEKKEEPKDFFNEIIEVGVVVLNPNTGKIVEEYGTFVKPILFPLTKDAIHLTTITQEQANQGIPLSVLMTQLKSLEKKHKAVFCSWGEYDRKQFERACKRFGMTYPFSKAHISLKHEHAAFYQHTEFIKKHSRKDRDGRLKGVGMEAALSFHGIPLKGTHHRGIDDSHNIAQIAKKMLQDGWNHRFLTS